MREYFLEREDEYESEFYRKFFENAEALIRGREEALLAFDFVILKPDAVARGLVRRILSELRGAGIHPVAARPFVFGETVKEDLYRFVKKKYFSTWWVYGAYYLGPSIALLLRGEKGSYDHLPALVRALIGPTTPWVGNGIRFKLSGTNRLFNLIHASDDPAAALREALIFFDEAEIVKALEHPEPVEVGELATEPRALDWPSVSSRILASLAGALESRGVGADDLRSLSSRLGALSGQTPDRFLSGMAEMASDALSVLDSLAERVSDRALEALRGTLPGNRNPEVLDLPPLLSSIEAAKGIFDFHWMADPSYEIRLAGVHATLSLDAWDLAVLHTTHATMPQVLRNLREEGMPYPKG